MTDHKSTDDEVIKALSICSFGECEGCPYAVIGNARCLMFLTGDALALINRQKAEIEATEKECADWLGQRNAVEMMLNRANEEIERLNTVHADMTESLRLAAEANKDMSVELDAMRGAANSYKMHYENARAEAIKEFAERLIDKCTDPHWCVWMSEIEDLVTEMTENKR